MANMCDFSMKIAGEKKNVDSFVSALEQKGRLCMGRGAWVTLRDDLDDESILFGEVKWSLKVSLVDNAFSMRKQKKTGEGCWANFDGFIDNHEFLSLPEASKKYNKVCKKPNHHKKIFPNKVAVVVEDKKGKVYRFESQTEAAKFLGIPQSAISTALSGDGYTHGYRIRKPFRVNGQLPPRQEPPLNA